MTGIYCISLFYALNLIELEVLKAYIKTHLKICFIQLLNLLVCILILFDKRLNKNLYLHVNYQDFNNLIIINWYLIL